MALDNKRNKKRTENPDPKSLYHDDDQDLYGKQEGDVSIMDSEDPMYSSDYKEHEATGPKTKMVSKKLRKKGPPLSYKSSAQGE